MNDLSKEWSYIFWNLGSPTEYDRRGSLQVMSTHVVALCGLAAAWIAPQLENRYYLSLCVAMIAIGMFHDWDVARFRVDPIGIASMNIRQGGGEYRRDLPRD